jgi:hypothetical protein
VPDQRRQYALLMRLSQVRLPASFDDAAIASDVAELERQGLIVTNRSAQARRAGQPTGHEVVVTGITAQGREEL